MVRRRDIVKSKFQNARQGRGRVVTNELALVGADSELSGIKFEHVQFNLLKEQLAEADALKRDPPPIPADISPAPGAKAPKPKPKPKPPAPGRMGKGCAEVLITELYNEGMGVDNDLFQEREDLTLTCPRRATP